MHLFRPSPAYRVLSEPYGYWSRRAGRAKYYQLSLEIPTTYRISETEHGTRSIAPIDAGQNPPDGVVITYFLAAEPEGEATLTLMDAGGSIVRRFSSVSVERRVPAKVGMNKVCMGHET